MLVIFRNVRLMEFLVMYLVLFFSVIKIEGFKWFWMGSLHKNIQLMLYFLKIPFLVLHLSYYTLMIFLIMLYVIFLSMLMILLSVLSMIRHLICNNNLNWLLNFNWSMRHCGHLNSLITLVLLSWRWMTLFFRKNPLLRCLGWPFLLNWIGALTLSNNWSLDFFYEVSFFWGCSVSL